jgi:hypothetical protein
MAKGREGSGRSRWSCCCLFLNVEEESEGILLSFTADTRHFPPARFETLLRSVEDLAVEAALDPAAPTGVASADTRFRPARTL